MPGAGAGVAVPMAAPPPDDRDPFDEAAFLARLRAGDEAAFAELVHRHSGRVFAVALRMLRNEQDALDVVQETFLNAHRRIGSFRGEAPIGGWLARIAANASLMKLRTRRRKPETSLELPGPAFDARGGHQRDIVDIAPLAEKVALDRELGRRIREAVDALPETHRAVMLLADYQHLSMREIAEALDLTVANVKTRLHRARLAVRESLAAYLEGRE